MRIHHTAQWRRMVRAMGRRGGAYSPYAVATARLGPSRLNPYETYGQEMRRKYPGRPWITRPTWELKNMFKALNMMRAMNTAEEEKRLAEVMYELKMRRALKNPLSSKTKRRAVRVASKLAYRIWQHVKSKGYALPVPKRTPKLVKEYARKILKANGINWTIKNPAKGRGIDKPAARELELYIENDRDLYRQRFLPMVLNLQRKIKKGVFRQRLAIKMFQYLSDDGAKKYAREFGGPGTPWNVMFPKRTRRMVAARLVRHFISEIRAGNYWT
jgi:hypothetical protein